MATIQYSPEWRETISHLVNRVSRLAASSGRIDSVQLDKLRLALKQRFVEPLQGPHEKEDYLRQVLPERYGSTTPVQPRNER